MRNRETELFDKIIGSGNVITLFGFKSLNPGIDDLYDILKFCSPKYGTYPLKLSLNGSTKQRRNKKYYSLASEKIGSYPTRSETGFLEDPTMPFRSVSWPQAGLAQLKIDRQTKGALISGAITDKPTADKKDMKTGNLSLMQKISRPFDKIFKHENLTSPTAIARERNRAINGNKSLLNSEVLMKPSDIIRPLSTPQTAFAVVTDNSKQDLNSLHDGIKPAAFSGNTISGIVDRLNKKISMATRNLIGNFTSLTSPDLKLDFALGDSFVSNPGLSGTANEMITGGVQKKEETNINTRNNTFEIPKFCDTVEIHIANPDNKGYRDIEDEIAGVLKKVLSNYV